MKIHVPILSFLAIAITMLALFSYLPGSVTSASTESDDTDCIVTVGCDTVITIVLDLNPEATDPDVEFSGDLGLFTLEDTDRGRKEKFIVEPGEYVVTIHEPVGYNLTDIECEGDRGAQESIVNERVRIDADLDEVIACKFVLTKDATATPTSTSTPTATATPKPVETAVPMTVNVNPNLLPPQIIDNSVTVNLPPSVPVIAPTIQPARISPPSTGSAGLATGPCNWTNTLVVVDAHYEWRWSSWRGLYPVYVPYSTYWVTECVYE